MEEKLQKGKSLRVRGLRQRWLLNTVMPVLLLLLLTVVLFSVGVSSYYYMSMRDGLEKQAQVLSGAFEEYFMDGGYASYIKKAQQSTDTFEDKERIELQFINTSGRIQASSTGLTAGTFPGTDEITRAITQNRMDYFQGRDPETGENILAVSHPLTFNGQVKAVVRLVTSLRLVNRQVMLAVLFICLVAVLCMALVDRKSVV